MSYCFVVPNYNHCHSLDTLIERLGTFEIPVFMVDDGSNEVTKTAFKHLDQKHDFLTIITHEKNQGKGGAVQTGLIAAFDAGFSHAIQIDADGQHDLTDINRFVADSKLNPLSLISGKPIYDESIPKARYYARNITHFWVWVETLSFHIKDTMCGFRVYPLKATVALLRSQHLGKRMDFDIEVMVKLYWREVDLRFISTKVDYPEHGVSHFKPFKDNVLISWMHTRLFFGMIVRAPALIARKWR